MDTKKPAVIEERATAPRSYVVVTQAGDPTPNPEKSSKPSVPPHTFQQESPHKVGTTTSSLSSPQYGSPGNKTSTDDVKTTISERVVRPTITINL